MTLSIFDLFFTMFGYAWKLLSWVADLSLRFFGAVFSFGIRAVGAVFDLMLTPFTHGFGCFTDWPAMDLRGFFSLGMWVLLGACALVAALALGSNVYRRYRSRM